MKTSLLIGSMLVGATVFGAVPALALTPSTVRFTVDNTTRVFGNNLVSVPINRSNYTCYLKEIFVRGNLGAGGVEIEYGYGASGDMWGARAENYSVTVECVRHTTLVDYNRATALTSDTFETYASVRQSNKRMFTGAAFCPLTGFANLRTPKAYTNIYLGQDSLGLPRWYMQSQGDGYAALADGMCTILGGGAARRQGRYSWHEGGPPMPMMSTSDGICWIAGVGGKFTNDGDGVRILAHDGIYLLDGESNGSGLWVDAECLDNR